MTGGAAWLPWRLTRSKTVRGLVALAAGLAAAALQAGFQFPDLLFQFLHFGLGALQHRGLYVELFPGHQVEFGESTLQDGAKIFLRVLFNLLYPGGQHRRQAVGEVVENLGVDHGRSLSILKTEFYGGWSTLFSLRELTEECSTTLRTYLVQSLLCPSMLVREPMGW